MTRLLVDAGSPPVPVGSSGAVVLFTGRHHGDMRVALRSSGIHRARQVHGATVLRVEGSAAPTDPRDPSGSTDLPLRVVDEEFPCGDALVSDDPSSILAVLTADCVPLALGSRSGVFGAVHCGWRGVVAGVLPAALTVMESMGARRIEAVVGPCIGPECYAFGADDLESVAAVAGGAVRARTPSGAPALDMRRAVSAVLDSCGVPIGHIDDRCTACSGEFFSARAHADEKRQACIVSWGPLPGTWT